MNIRDEFLPFGKPLFSEGEIEAVTRVLQTGWVGMGPLTISFEEELARFVDAPHVVTVNSCTSALFLALLVHGIGPGDEVIVPSLTWCSTANAALYVGAKPIFCDVDVETFCVTPELILQKVTPRTKAVLVVHMGGLTVDIAAIRRALPEHIVLVEDAAHALGACYDNGKSVGSSGNTTCFSFYANKNLSTGEGGAIALFDRTLADRLRSLRQHALTADAWKRFSHPKAALIPGVIELGYKMNYTDLQASIGRVQLARQSEFHATRLTIAKAYYEALCSTKPAIRFQKNILHGHHARHLFQILLPIEDLSLSRDELLLALRERKIGASIHYAPLHLMPLYAAMTTGELPNTEYLNKRLLTLPISASMNTTDADYVISHFRELISRAVIN